MNGKLCRFASTVGLRLVKGAVHGGRLGLRPLAVRTCRTFVLNARGVGAEQARLHAAGLAIGEVRLVRQISHRSAPTPLPRASSELAFVATRSGAPLVTPPLSAVPLRPRGQVATQSAVGRRPAVDCYAVIRSLVLRDTESDDRKSRCRSRARPRFSDVIIPSTPRSFAAPPRPTAATPQMTSRWRVAGDLRMT